MLAYMTKEQIYSMRMEVADNLEKNGPECAACKSKRTEGMENKDGYRLRSYSIDTKRCTCLVERPNIYSEISVLYTSIGMVFLPPYFMRKAAQAKNSLNFPVEALYYVQIAEKLMPQYLMMSDEDRWKAESYFDPLTLDASFKKTQAESYLLLGETYYAASYTFQALEMLGMDEVCFFGVFKPKEFKKILPKFRLLHAENITKLIGILAKAYLRAHSLKLAQNLLTIEYIALSLYPIDFLQVLNHMTSMYQLKYLIHEQGNLQELQTNIFKLCHAKLHNFHELMDLTEVNGIGSAYCTITEINLVLAQFDKAENTAKEALRILQLVNDSYMRAKIRIFLSHIYYHKKKYLNCSYAVADLGEMPAASTSRIIRALHICSLSMLLRKSTEGIHKNEVALTFDKCNAFASEWNSKSSRIMPKEIAFYVSICLARWCLHSDKNTMWVAGKSVFSKCYDMAVDLHVIVDKSKHNYWLITAILLLLKLQVKSMKESIEGVSVDAHFIQENLDYLKHKIKTNYPLHMVTYKKLVEGIQDKAKKE